MCWEALYRMSISNVIALLGGVALFLFGMSLMGDGLKRVAGNRLELVLYKLSSTPLKGILLGTGVTAVIQSSSATSVMVVGFVNSGMVGLRQAIGIIMGSFIGTSVTGWVICLSAIGGSAGGWASLLSTSTLTGVIAIVGIVLRMFCKSRTKQSVGDILLGFAVLMYGISAMGTAVAPLKESAAFVEVMTRFTNPVLGLLAGIVITAVLQSASSAVGLLQTLAVTGVIDFAMAFPILLGMGIGASVPVLISSLGATTDAKRSAWSYLVISVLGAAAVGAVFYILHAVFSFSFMEADPWWMTAVSIALVNSLFRFAAVLVQAPFIGRITRFLQRVIPETKQEQTMIPPLEERFLSNPTVALDHARTAVFAMADTAEENLSAAMDLLRSWSEEGFRAVEAREKVVDRYEDRLGSYLVCITQTALPEQQAAEVSKYLHAIGDLERISDHAVNIAECAQELQEKKIVLSDAAYRELTVLGDALMEILSMSMKAFGSNDLDLAFRVEPLEDLIDTLSDELKLHHVERLRRGLCTIDHGFVFNDLVTNYERVSDHCSNLAVAVIELDASGVFDTHEYLDSVKDLHSERFHELYESYAARYVIETE